MGAITSLKPEVQVERAEALSAAQSRVARLAAATDARCNQVAKYFTSCHDLKNMQFRPRWNEQHSAYLWLVTQACVEKMGLPLDLSDVIIDRKIRTAAWKTVQDLIVFGALRLAGVEVDLSGGEPKFTGLVLEK